MDARRGRWLAALLGLAMVGFGPLPLAAQPAPTNALPAAQLQRAGNEARNHLEHVSEFLAAEQWDEAVEAMQRVMTSDGNQWIALPDGVGSQQGLKQYISLREYGHLQLVSWHRQAPPALAVYRSRVDTLAQRWLREGRDARDGQRLQEVIDQFFASSYGDDALLALGDLALQQGDLVAARRCWERVHPSLRTPAGQPLWLAFRDLAAEQIDQIMPRYAAQAQITGQWLVYPDSDIPPADVLARLVLVSIVEGHLHRAEIELRCLRAAFPDAEGVLAGRSGPWHTLLAETLSASRAWPTNPPHPGGWTTFAGDGSRNARLPFELDVSVTPRWAIDLPRISVDGETIGLNRPRVAEQAEGLLSYYPVIAEGRALVQEPQQIRELDLKTGRVPRPQSQNLGWSEDGAQLRSIQHSGVPRNTLTVHENRLYARIGDPWTAVAVADGSLEPESRLLAVDLRTQRLLFVIRPDDKSWNFDGCPIVEDGRVYCCLRRRDQVNTQLRVACFHAVSGRRLWQTDVCRSDSGGQAIEATHTLLTVSGDRLYLNTNLGIVASLDATRGQLVWMTAYPRVGATRDPDVSDRHRFRDLTPCLLYRDMVIVAPRDADRLLALNAASGHPIWMTAPQQAADVVHLLGAVDDRLIGSGDYLYWMDVYDGDIVGQFPAQRKRGGGFSLPSVRGVGRGLIAGSTVYWPTAENLYLMDVHEPRMVAQPILLDTWGLVGGNLAYADGQLLIASADRLLALDALPARPDPGSGQPAGNAGGAVTIPGGRPPGRSD